MTSATDELRRLLDERRVEWMDDSYAQLWCTVWHGQDGKQWRMIENQSGMLTELKAWKATPAQAIDATLGRGTCHIDLVGYDEREDRFQCRSCDWSMRLKRGTWPRFNYCPNCGRRVIGGVDAN